MPCAVLLSAHGVCGILGNGAWRRARSRPQLRPLLLQPLRRDGDRGAELLGEKRDAVFLEHPTQVHQLRVEDALRLMMPGLLQVKLPARLELLELLASRAARRPAGSPGGSGWRGNSAGIAAASPRAFSRNDCGSIKLRDLLADVVDGVLPAGRGCRRRLAPACRLRDAAQ